LRRGDSLKVYATDSAFRTALDARLRAYARKRGVSIVRLRKEVVFERLLARLLQVQPSGWMLKGAIALEFRLRDLARASTDVDLEGFTSLEDAERVLQRSAVLDLGDRFGFAITRLRTAPTDTGPTLATYQVTAELGGRTFDQAHADVQLGRQAPIAPEFIAGPDYLAFAGVPSILVPALPLPFQIAEKVHAYTRRYVDGRPSTRVKDLVDLTLITTSIPYDVDCMALAAAITRTFAERATHPVPRALPPPPSDWATSYANQAKEAGLRAVMSDAHAKVAALVDPALKTALT